MKVIFIPDYRKGNPYQKALADSLLKEGVNIHFCVASHPYLFSVFKSIKNNWKPNILHLHWHHPFLLSDNIIKTFFKSVSFICELLTLKLLGIKIVWTVHNIVSHEKKFESMELFFCKILSRLCNKIIVHSPSAKKKVIEIYKVNNSSIVVIPHGNYINTYKNVVSKSNARNQLKINIDDLVYLYFGLIRPYKGVSELIKAFKKLNDTHAKLWIVGKPYNDKIANNIRRLCNEHENIKFVFESIPNDAVQIYMNAADVIVLPYRDILTSGVVILAMSFGKPVIAPSIGCIPDILDTKGGILYDPSDKEGLLKAIKQALNVNLKEMGRYNFRLAKQFQWSDIARKTYEVYNDILKINKQSRCWDTKIRGMLRRWCKINLLV